ncbi:MAG: hypothetical protein H6531_08720 [Actinobacteria bacterium]|nr:hypothetical protein [Thermoleophilia bacterium]MCB9011898.1 hypothetical protein [Actinomycetota bacterium]
MVHPPAFLRHALTAIVLIALIVGVVVKVTAHDDATADAQTPPAERLAELPGGGRSILPEHRVVVHYGSPLDRKLGVLGFGTPDEAGIRLLGTADDYRAPDQKPVLPAMELIAVLVTADPGDGTHRLRMDRAMIEGYLSAARSVGAILILDIQPGRSDFLTEAKALETYLLEPDVSLAIDPEWRMGPDEIPGKVIGHVDAVEVNRVTAWLSKLVKEHKLPNKLLVIHQFEDGMIARRDRLTTKPGIDAVLNADGFGTREMKVNTYNRVTRGRGKFATGFKLFYEEDTGLMTPRQVLRLRPVPDVVMYE